MRRVPHHNQHTILRGQRMQFSSAAAAKPSAADTPTAATGARPRKTVVPMRTAMPPDVQMGFGSQQLKGACTEATDGGPSPRPPCCALNQLVLAHFAIPIARLNSPMQLLTLRAPTGVQNVCLPAVSPGSQLQAQQNMQDKAHNVAAGVGRRAHSPKTVMFPLNRVLCKVARKVARTGRRASTRQAAACSSSVINPSWRASL